MFVACLPAVTCRLGIDHYVQLAKLCLTCYIYIYIYKLVLDVVLNLCNIGCVLIH